jgi:hypothetical protein
VRINTIKPFCPPLVPMGDPDGGVQNPRHDIRIYCALSASIDRPWLRSNLLNAYVCLLCIMKFHSASALVPFVFVPLEQLKKIQWKWPRNVEYYWKQSRHRQRASDPRSYANVMRADCQVFILLENGVCHSTVWLFNYIV